MSSEQDPDALTNTLRPLSDSVLTIRVIKSFPYRIVKNLVLQHVNLTETTVQQLQDMAVEEIKTRSGWKVFKAVQLDTLKLYTHAHGSKTTNLIINLDHQDWILSEPDAILQDLDIQNETELSFFNRAEYESFIKDPIEKWQ